MEFTITTNADATLSDAEITDLLTGTYVKTGFTPAGEATTLFAPAAVRQRGIIFTARVCDTGEFAGMVVVAPPTSAARRVAQGPDAEMQLLAVKELYQGRGLGLRLVQEAIDHAQQAGYPKMMLFTQLAMHAAQHLYQKTGFVYLHNLERNGRHYKVYERVLNDGHNAG